MQAVHVNACNGNETWKSNSFVHIAGRPVTSGFGACAAPGHNAFTSDSNVMLDMTMAAGSQPLNTVDHGELYEFGKSLPGSVPVEMNYHNDVIVQEGIPADNTALLWFGSGDHSGPLNIDVLTIDHETALAYAMPGQTGSAAYTVSRILGTATAKINKLVFTNNRLGGVGAPASYNLFINDGPPANAPIPTIVWSGNTCPDGTPITGFGTGARPPC